MSGSIVILDYGLGNIRSVQNAFSRLSIPVEISRDRTVIEKSKGLVIPGVGSFGAAVKNLESLGLKEYLKELVSSGNKPVLGICLGMQLLFEGSNEGGKHEGLGVFSGWVKKIENKYSSSSFNIGWSTLDIKTKNPIYSGMKEASSFYFNHEYALENSSDEVDALIDLDIGKCPVSVRKDLIFGVQYHPERSQDAGLRVLRQFSNFASNLEVK